MCCDMGYRGCGGDTVVIWEFGGGGGGHTVVIWEFGGRGGAQFFKMGNMFPWLS